MNNFTSMVVAILEKLGLLTEEEAVKLAKELHEATLPDNYRSASVLLEDIHKKLNIKTFDNKIDLASSVSSLEQRLTSLENKAKPKS